MDKWMLKEKIALASKILVMEGQGDFTLGHITALDSDGRMWMKPSKFGQEEISAGDVIAIDDTGKVLEGWHTPHNEFPIHTCIYKARPDIKSVVHTHPPYSIAFGTFGKKLQMLCHDAAPFAGRLGYFDETPDLIVTQEQGDSLASVLGDGKAVLLKNHGIVTAGATVEEAVCLALHLEKACRIQLLAGDAGIPMSDEIALKMRDDCERTAGRRYAGFFAYLVNKLIRTGASQSVYVRP